MKKSLLTLAVIVCASLAACQTTQPLTPAQKLSIAEETVDLTCALASDLIASGQVHGKDADNAIAACSTARTALIALQAVIPPDAGASGAGS